MRARIQASPRYRWWVLGVVLSGFVSTGISITILSAVLPTIGREFGVGDATIAWVVTGPMLAFGIVMPTMGKAADLYGRKTIYLASWIGAMALTVGAALSWNAGSLIAFRILAAVVGAGTGPTSMAIILSAFSASERVKAMSWWSFLGAGTPVVGLVIGGPLVDLVGWRWIFGVQLPLAAPAIALAWFLVRDDAPSSRPVFDVRGSITLGLASGCLLFGMNRAGVAGWTSPWVLAPLIASPVFGTLFVLAERNHPEPLLPLRYFRRRNVTVPVALQLIAHVPYMGCFFISPFLLHSVLGYDNARTSFALIPRPLANSLFSFLAGYVTVRLGERFSASVGMLTLTGGMLVLAQIGADSSVVHVLASMALTGAGMGLAYPGLVSSVANAVSEHDFGAISGAQEMAQMIGMVAGMQGFQTIQSIRARSVGLEASYQQTFLVGAVIGGLAFALALFVRSMHRARPAPPSESPEAPYLPEVTGELALEPGGGGGD